MARGGMLLSSKKYLAWMALALFTVLVLLSPRAYAANSRGGMACSTSTPPTPYTNGAPVVRAFYPADGSTVTVTSTGAVIKQSPCQTPYREGWVNPANICNLNSFDQLGGMISSSDSNPYPNTAPVYICGTTAPTPTPAPTPAPVTPVTTTTGTSSPTTPTKKPHEHGVVQSETTSAPSPTPTPAAATALPDTGPSGVVAVGSISTVLGTVGHFFYRRRVAN